MAYNGTNPVSVGNETLKSHYDRVFDNTTYLYANRASVKAASLVLSTSNFIEKTDGFTGSATVLGIASTGSTIMALGSTGATTYQMSLSTNGGRTWAMSSPTISEFDYPEDLIHDGTNWVACGRLTAPNTKAIAYSTNNGAAWTGVAIGSGVDLLALCYSGTTYVAVGASGAIYTATTVSGTWTARTADAGFAGNFFGVCWSAALSLFIAVGGTGAATSIQTSPDGTTWTARTAGSSYTGDFEDVAEVSGVSSTFLVAVGDAGEIQTSTDGITWTRLINGNDTTNDFYAISPGMNGALIVGETGAMQIVWDSSYAWALPDLGASNFRGCHYVSDSIGFIIGSISKLYQSFPALFVMT